VRVTPQGGSAIVKSMQRESGFTVEITDTGKGMSEEQMSTLFSRFKTRKETNESGAGIGLAIAKTIADLHKIEVSVDTKIEKGTTFSFIFFKNS
jgi:signal transduction histidine kinase